MRRRYRSGIAALAAAAALVLAGCGGGSTPAPTPAAPATPATPPTPTPTPAPGAGSVTIVSGARNLGSLAYSPNPLTVPAGATVTWTNGDTSTHGAVSDAGVFGSGSLAPGGTYSVVLQTRGTFAYHCPIHASMTGTVVVQ